MDNEWLSRTRLLVDDLKLERLNKAHVLVVGLGGVGAYAAELICRAGVGKITVVDGDTIHATNRNRQLLALTSTEGRPKATLMAERLKEINPEAEIIAINEYIQDDQMAELLKVPYDYVVDAIDTLSPKINLIFHAVKNNMRIVSSMGSGGKLDPTGIRIDDISKSYNCRLAYILRKKLRKLGISKGIKVVYSVELVVKESVIPCDDELNKKSIVGTISFMPPAFGCFIASVVINDLLNDLSVADGAK